jgi:hypothetical protein
MRPFRYTLTAFAAILAILPAVAGTPSSAGDRQLYVRKYKNLAINEMKRSGIPASIILAQGMLESDCGKSPLAVDGKNHFGIKCHGWEGESVYVDDDDAHECFRKYESVRQSYRDHSDFLTTGTRYKSLFELSQNDYIGWARGLQACGYATDTAYASHLINLIESCGLSRYDGMNATGVPEAVPSFELFEEDDPALCKVWLSRQVLQKGGAPYIIACSSDSYKSIAKEYGLFVWELLRFNHLKRAPARIDDGTAVFIGRKM